MNVERLITELGNFPSNKEVRFFTIGEFSQEEVELKINEYDQDEKGNPTFFLVATKG